MRVKRAGLEAAVSRLAERLGKPKGPAWTRDEKTGRTVARVGVWELDHNSIYGGYVIQEIHNDAGGVCLPLGGTRVKGEELLRMIHAAHCALDIVADSRQGVAR